MNYRILESALVVLLGGGIAIADEGKTQPEQSRSEVPAERVENVDLFFNTDSAQLADRATDDLQQLADWAKCDPQNAIILEGYADPRGTKNHNLSLSGERAAVVRKTLIDMGVPSQRIVVTVYGENGPRLDSLGKERRVTARATETPVTPDELGG